MNDVIVKEEIIIENLIYEVRGKQVMLDSDLARLYETETKRINEAIYRNKEKFPERFCFRITEDEYKSLKSQIATSKGGSRKGHTVFTEQGDVNKKFSERTLRRIRQFYIKFKNWSSLPTELTFSHYTELLKLDDSNEIDFYIKLANC